ncbi:MAG: MFS transporter [Planctomycetota bacterium]
MLESVPRVSRYTWVRLWPAYALLGSSQAIVWLSDFVAKRSLGAPDWVVPLLLTAFQVSWIFSPALEPLMARQNAQSLFRKIGLLSYLPMLAVAFVAVVPVGPGGAGEGHLVLFLVLMIAHFAIDTAFIPHRGALLTANFPARVRGRMYGLATAISLVCMTLFSKACGSVLDGDPRWLRFLFPLGGLLGLWACFLLARIRWRHGARPAIADGDGMWREVRGTWGNVLTVFRTDRAFFKYEAGYMLYGVGFLMFWPIMVLFAEGDLGLSYGSWTSARGVAWPLGIMVATPFAGRLCDKIGVVRSTALAFALLGSVFASMAFVKTEFGLIAGFAFFGIAMAGVDVGWSLGPLHFAPKGRSRSYAGIHVAMVGVRSLFAPMFGYTMLKEVGFQAACLTAATMVLCGSAVLLLFVPRNAPAA